MMTSYEVIKAGVDMEWLHEHQKIRIVIAALVTVVGMAMNAWMHAMYLILGLFIPLIVVNCAILGRAEAFASKNRRA